MANTDSKNAHEQIETAAADSAEPQHKGGVGKFFKNFMIVLLSAFFGSSVQIFVLIPCGMTSGGLPGVVRIITHFFPQLGYSVV